MCRLPYSFFIVFFLALTGILAAQIFVGGVAQVVNPGGAVVLPGTPGAVAYYTAPGTVVVPTPNVFVSGSNLGIGTSAPVSALHVVGTVTASVVSASGITNLNPFDNSAQIATDAFVQAQSQLSKSTTPLVLTGGVYSFDSHGSGGIIVVNANGAGGAITGILNYVSGGSGYAVGDLLTVSTGNHDAILCVTSVSGSAFTALSVVYGGTGYTTGGNLPTAAKSTLSSTFTLTGALTSNVTVLATPGVYLTQSNQWYINNNTTGNYTVTWYVSNGSDAPTGNGVVIPQSSVANQCSTIVQTDGETDVWFVGGACFPVGNKLGIGTSSPTTALDVNGDITMETGTAGNMLCLTSTHAFGHCTAAVSCAGSACACTCTAN